MLHRFTKTQFDYLLTTDFGLLEFFTGAISYRGCTLSRLALVDFCSLLYKKLQAHSTVIDGFYKLAPACSWGSLPYRDLNALVCVLLMDYLQQNCCYAPHIIDAYVNNLIDAPFASFLSISKIDVELPVGVTTIYSYDGKRFYSESDLWDYVHKQYPQSKYNVSLKF